MLVAALTLTGCGLLTRSAVPDRPELPDLPVTLTDCAMLASIGERIGPVETVPDTLALDLWAQDRAVALQCRQRLLALVGIYRALQLDLKRPD